MKNSYGITPRGGWFIDVLDSCSTFVRRFITRNSFKEKIDAMLSSKQGLAVMTVKSGESWLALMSHEELRELFGRRGGNLC